METRNGVLLTDEQTKLVKSMDRLLKRWDKNLAINCVAGTFHIMLIGDTEQNPNPEMSDTGGFNPDNIAYTNISVNADGGDW